MLCRTQLCFSVGEAYQKPSEHDFRLMAPAKWFPLDPTQKIQALSKVAGAHRRLPRIGGIDAKLLQLPCFFDAVGISGGGTHPDIVVYIDHNPLPPQSNTTDGVITTGVSPLPVLPSGARITMRKMPRGNSCTTNRPIGSATVRC